MMKDQRLEEGDTAEDEKSVSVSVSVSSTSKVETNNDFEQQNFASFFQLVMNKGEGDAVACFKLLVIGMLVIAALVVGNAAFVFMSEEVNKDYKSSFTSYALEIFVESQNRVSSSLTAMGSLSDNLISNALDTEQSWPFVTIADFEARHDDFIRISRAEDIKLFPFISESDRAGWEEYSVSNQGWIQEGLTFAGKGSASNITEHIHQGNGDRDPGPADPYYAPCWQTAPAPIKPDIVNFNAFVSPELRRSIHWMQQTMQPVMSDVLPLSTDYPEPRFHLVRPIFENFDTDSELVGALVTTISWKEILWNLVPTSTEGIVVGVANSCEQTFTFEIYGSEAIFIGIGDIHDRNYEKQVLATKLVPYREEDMKAPMCEYTLSVYSSETFRKSFNSNEPLIYTSAVIILFSLTMTLFCLYDCCVERRQETIEKSAARSNAIVDSLFPENVRDRLLKDTETPVKGKQTPLLHVVKDTEKVQLMVSKEKPIADHFSKTTVMFSDIAGFTAWSSIREPAHVFTLLESIYNSFDEIAKRRRVFKVETIGDCYVAVCGVPQPRKDHAVVMARFAFDCLAKMNEMVKKLELRLGPDTRDLSMRFGLHSGPVTGGVLRGERSRFQLFGDTVNTAARMESTGESNMIQLSRDTADLLIAAGKSHWLTPRTDKVMAKGKGELQTYWLSKKTKSDELSVDSIMSQTSSSPTGKDDNTPKQAALSEKVRILVQWNTQVLIRSLKKIVAMRGDSVEFEKDDSADGFNLGTALTGDVLGEVKEIIELPAKIGRYRKNPEDVRLPPEVEVQLNHFVTTVASMYRDNHFHDFDHASHVAMSATKLLSRIVAPNDIDYSDMTYKEQSDDKLHEFTYGITSDPLTQFAIVFSALIHDIDHCGVPNAQLVKENATIAKIYNNRSIAEQNSVDLAWCLLLEPCYEQLRNNIWRNKVEKDRFRQLVVNVVMATDIADKELGTLRRERWEKAFNKIDENEPKQVDINRKATIVIEHLIQASDVAHTMQHWHIYQKWNQRLFQECYLAYKTGRSEKDPAEGWYQGELGFFDFYIIPLAKKLKECGVFGASSDEYLNYAVANRREWEKKGKAIVERFNQKAVSSYEAKA